MKHKFQAKGPKQFFMKGCSSGCCSSMGFDKFFTFDNHGKGHRGGRIHQEIVEGSLVVTSVLPGLEKASLKIRAKPDKLSITANRKADLKMFHNKEINQIIDLQEDVKPASSKAKYTDGILVISLEIADPGYEINDIEK